MDVKTVLESAMHKAWPITLHTLPQNRASGANTRHVMGYTEGNELVQGRCTCQEVEAQKTAVRASTRGRGSQST